MEPVIRIARDSDAPAIASIYAPFCEATAVSFEYVAPTAGEMAGRMNDLAPAFPWLVLDEGGIILGYVYGSPHRSRAAYRWSVDVSAYVDPAYRRRGIARSLYTALFALLRLQGFYKAYAGITLPNPASIGLHEAVGFRPVGIYWGVGYKLGAWHDVAWYQLSLQPEQLDPPPPLPLSAIHGTPGWNKALAKGLDHYRLGNTRM